MSESEMNQLEELAKLVNKAITSINIGSDLPLEVEIAENLIKYGVIVPPVNVGQEVYYLNKNGICIAEVVKIELNAFTNPQMWLTIGYLSNVTGVYEYCKSSIDFIMNKTLFLTKEAAEKALEGGGRRK